MATGLNHEFALDFEQEERHLQQRTNPKGLISVELDATDVFDTYYDEDDAFADYGDAG